MSRIWQHMDIQSKALKKKSKSVSYYVQTAIEKRQRKSKIGTLTNSEKGVKNGKRNRHGKRYIEIKKGSQRYKRRVKRNVK